MQIFKATLSPRIAGFNSNIKDSDTRIEDEIGENPVCRYYKHGYLLHNVKHLMVQRNCSKYLFME